ncbi:MAG: glycosyltransferase [Muribaculaceae bacterium]|nr:glycosyltransferase [Muribaculaceae bacterium]
MFEHITIFDLSLIGITLIATLWLVTFYRHRISIVAKAVVANAKIPIEGMPSVSVIVYADGNASALSRMLPQVLKQEYPTRFEVIVVNDGSDEDVKDVVNLLNYQYDNLYQTFIPDDCRNVSRKKLALTIGIKAAHTDIVVLTTADSTILSNKWLALMSRHFINDETDIVIGNAMPDPRQDRAKGYRFRAFSTLTDSVHFLSSAIVGRAYRGTGCNIAYRTRLFFNNKGFCSSTNFHHGDDDIFIANVATSSNTAVEITPEALITTAVYNAKKEYRIEKLRRTFTARHLPAQGQRRFYGFSSAMLYCWLTASASAIVYGWQNCFLMSAIAITGISLLTTLTITWRRTSISLGSRPFLLTIPVFLLWQPIHNVIFKVISRLNTSQNFTWQSITR